MINFKKQIKEVLFEHDFIILPRLGAFIADFSIDQEAKQPIKTFTFNGLLNSDENNKFFNYILNKETLPFSEIEIEWNSFLSNLKKELGSKKRVEIPGVGFLYNEGDSIFFKIQEGINFYDRGNFIADPQSIGADIESATQIEQNLSNSEEIETTAAKLDNEIRQDKSNEVDFSEKELKPIISSEEDLTPSIQEEAMLIESNETIAETVDEEEIEEVYQESTDYVEEIYEEEERRTRFLWWLLPLLVVGAFAFWYWWNNFRNETKIVQNGVVATDSTTVDAESMSNELEDSINIKTPIEESSEPILTSSTQEYPFHVWAGLFRKESNANKLRDKLRKNKIPAEIQNVKNMRRVYVPVRNEKEAIEMVSRIEQLTGDKAVYFEIE